MAIRLVTRGDDLGSFRAANRAILDAHKNGILKNTSLMVPTPAFEDAAELVRSVKDICLGLHVTLTAEWDAPRWGPVAPRERVRSLIDEQGCFFPDPMTIHKRHVDLDELMIEVQAQLDKARAAGLNIQYVDEHMGVGWIHPEGRRDSRLWVRLSELCRKEGLVWHLDVAKNNLPEIESEGLTLQQQIIRRIDKATPGNYLLCTHPAYDTPELQEVSNSGCPRGTLGQTREADHKMLCDPAFIDALKSRGVEIITYRV
jgi:predicted glycoside hydrolase/deacetylase ChbG (UPF0249 family)